MADELKKNKASRRAFLKSAGATVAGGSAIIAGGGTVLSAGNAENLPPNIPDWSKYLGAGVDARPYGTPSEHEKNVVRRNVAWLTASPQSSVNFTPLHDLDGIITPNGLCFERHHGGIAQVEPADHRLMINGLVEKPLMFSMADMSGFLGKIEFTFWNVPRTLGWSGVGRNEWLSVTHGMVHCVQYTGVPLKYVLEEAGLKTSAKWIMPEGGDSSGMNRSVPLEKALGDCLLAFKMNGEALRPEQGYPLRLVVPGWEGNMWVKWLRRIEVGDMPWHTREETSKYTDLLENGKSRRFTWVMDCKSVITNPSPQAPLKHKGGHTVLSGLAWSGRGRISRVDVSLDGGKNWHSARIDPLSLPMALHRFYYEFDWNGKPLLLQSRAIDETGYIQPTKDELREVRGSNSIYHNNGIQTWHVKADGEVENVEVS